MLDKSTTVFVVVLVIGFVYLRTRLNSKRSLEREMRRNRAKFDRLRERGGSGSLGGNSKVGENGLEEEDAEREERMERMLKIPKRAITNDMVEIVQTMAPMLSVEQIRYSLSKTGSIELTMNDVLAGKEFPFPPTKESREEKKDDDEEEEEEEEEEDSE